ncbi:MAG TPA: glycosyltransferase family A protein, partial [Nitrososphaeraceae archaeon]|nr:glycosyltransferase family A protein [Nitrososphaeraceae archaeon]
MAGVLITWVYFLIFMLHSISKSPKLEDFIDHNRNKSYKYPKVSIILPARNEEKYLGSCIDSLLKQTYPNYEIIIVNDDSYDDTLNIMNYYEEHNPKVIICTTPPRPEGWIGKNWACFNGYIKSSGSLLLFTDADSYHSENTLKIAVENMIDNDLQ